MWAIGETDFYSMPADLRACIRWYARTDLKQLAHGRAGHQRAARGQARPGIRRRLRPGASPTTKPGCGWRPSSTSASSIPGITPARGMDRLKKKSVMKRIFQEAGLRVARGAVVSTVQEAHPPGRGTRLPGHPQAQRGRRRRRHPPGGGPAQLEALFPELREDYILEEFVEAPIVTYDGLTDRRRQRRLRKHADLRRGPDRIRPGQRHLFLCRPPHPASACAQIGAGRWSRRFGIRRKFFHFEFFVLGRGLRARSRSTAARRAGRSST
ncbi:MAG: hypothetical protein MZV70_35530 [Desulfobacterales bacterium]|nr:hypothetical protein [Desulfobacterales bacterium]